MNPYGGEMEPLHSTDPESVGPYRLFARLGAGGTGQAYLARSTDGRTVAVKVVRPELARDPDLRARLRGELAAARAVTGAQTVPVTDSDLDAPAPWLATTHVLGLSLADVVRDHGPLPEASVRALGTRLAEALEAIHRAGQVHRDLKPSTVLLTADGPRLLDGGIARAVDGDPTGRTAGSLGYLPPERTPDRAPGARGDVYSLACVLVHAATGHGPFDHRGHGEPDLTGVPAALRDVLEHCLRTDPVLRPAAAQLRAWLAVDAPTGSGLPTPVVAALARHAAAVTDLNTPLRAAAATPAPLAPAPALPYTPPEPRPARPAPAPSPEYPATPAASSAPRRSSGLSRRRLLLGGGSVAAAAAIGGTAWSLTRPKPAPHPQTPVAHATAGATPSGRPTPGSAPAAVWKYTTDAKLSGPHPALVLGDRVYTDATQLTALDAATGNVLWKRKNENTPQYAAAAGDLLCATGTQLQRVAPADGSTAAGTSPDYTGGKKLRAETFVAATDQAVFAKVTIARADSSGATRGLMAFRRGLTGQLWYQEDADVADLKTPGAVSGSTLLHLNNANAVVARNTADGKRLWKVETGGKTAGPVWCDDQRAYCAADGDGLQAVGLTDGKPVWHLTPSAGGRVGAVLVAGGTLYLSDGSATVSAHDAATGKVRWTCPLPHTPDPAVAPVLVGTTLFVAGSVAGSVTGSVAGQTPAVGVHAVDTTTGRLKWTYTDPAAPAANPSTDHWYLSTNGKLAFAWLGTTLHALPAD
ncbi:PQQ-binding-like beta-propeller repeat protein [Kitasatospora sp. NPDC097643]|uniref:protein kinase domain-containing protein n=1 Tax=Kitasatospora sp. NPDC097643 TaxID=3157230 RepID=UPI00331FC491